MLPGRFPSPKTGPHRVKLARVIVRNYPIYMQGLSLVKVTRSSADADNRLDAFRDHSRSANMVPFNIIWY